MAAMSLGLALLHLLLFALLWSSALGAKSGYPRLRLSHKELWELNRTWVFHSARRVLDVRAMLLDEYQERLFIGGRNALYSLSLERVNDEHREVYWPSSTTQVDDCLLKGRGKTECENYIKVLHHYNRTHLLACGTGAFDPTCAFIRVGRWTEDKRFELEANHIESGRGRCPFDPKSPCTSSFSRGVLYIGLYMDYWENDAALCRLSNVSFTRTEQNYRLQLNGFHSSPRATLALCGAPTHRCVFVFHGERASSFTTEPKFVGSAVIPDNDDQEDDKVYYFFTEKAEDSASGNNAVYTRIGRVCANDLGGLRVLVNKWSSFIKTRLLCSVPGPNGINTHFDDLEDVFVLKKKDERNPEIFGLFSTTSSVFKGYAVCVYHMADIREAFNGPYAYKEQPEHRWSPFEGKVPFPRPGSCASKVNGGQYSSSKDYPDQVLRFAQAHPVMYRPIYPVHRRPVMLETDRDRRFTQIAVDRVEAEDGHYNVLFIGTDNAVVLKVITIYSKESDTTEEVLLEEMHVFKVPVPITEILISSKRQQLYVSSEFGVAQVSIHHCDLYGSACTDCCLARDPYCAWDGVTCSRYYPSGLYSKRRFRRQDVRHGNAVQQCSGVQIIGDQLGKVEVRAVYGVENNSTLLECSPRSLQAKVLWYTQRGADNDEVMGDDRVVQTSHGLLFLKLRRSDAGAYVCQTEERSFVHTVARVTLEVLEEECLEEIFTRGAEEAVGMKAQHKIPCPLPGTAQGSTSQPWYKEFLQLIGYSNFYKLEEYCERVWCSDKKLKKFKSLPPKWKPPQGQERRGRTRYRTPRQALNTTRHDRLHTSQHLKMVG